MSSANDFFYNLPDMMKKAGQTSTQEQVMISIVDTCTRINNQVDDLIKINTELIKQHETMLTWIKDLQERQMRLIDTIYEICPGLMIIEEVADDQERKRLLRKYMNTAVNSDDDDDILDWVFMQENRPDEGT